MKVATILLSVVLAACSAVTAQSTTTGPATTSAVAASTSSTSVVSGTIVTPAQASEAACLKTCAANDATCQSNCVLVGVGVNPIADCLAACPHGNGTAAENNAYEQCIEGCISTATPQATAMPSSTLVTSASAATTAPGATSGGVSATAAGTVTGSSASPTATKNAAANLGKEVSIAGFLGIFAAIFMI